jgi:CelD/BcsL family acetyltransferase involved in cellulose biosynthesis
MVRKKPEIKIKTESFERFEAFFLEEGLGLGWDCLFVLPIWLKTWWDVFGSRKGPDILAGYCQGKLIGIAPLGVTGRTAAFIGGGNVCDYQDIILTSDNHQAFFAAVLSYLKTNGVRSLELDALRHDSVSLTGFSNTAEQMGYAVICDQVAIGYETALPRSWESYLYMLGGKQRHEIRRKLRRLDEAGNVRHRVVERPDEIPENMETFLSLFSTSRADKSEFMTEQMASFFLLLARRTAERGFLRLSFLEIDEVPAAAVMCFDYQHTIFLYNSGYNRRFRHLSVGLLSKVYSIKDSIERGRRRYDLLKGNEVYKKRLGGTPVPLYRLRIDLEE